MPSGPASGVGSANSTISPRSVDAARSCCAFSANHRLPSVPAAMPIGVAFAVGSANSANVPLSGSKRPIFDVPLSQNQSFPSGPSTGDVRLAAGARNPVLADRHLRTMRNSSCPGLHGDAPPGALRQRQHGMRRLHALQPRRDVVRKRGGLFAFRSTCSAMFSDVADSQLARRGEAPRNNAALGVEIEQLEAHAQPVIDLKLAADSGR